MKDRPILFSAPMVRAILEGRKTQTRRVVKPQPGDDDSVFTSIRCDWYHPTVIDRHGEEQPAEKQVYGFSDDDCGWPCRYGGPGDRLWVKETWQQVRRIDGEQWATVTGPCERGLTRIIYFADCENGKHPPRWRPSIYMPRWASRITLEITGVRVERLNEISDDDAVAEGIERVSQVGFMRAAGWRDYSGGAGFFDPRKSFQSLWDSINTKRYPWVSNPWVWVVEFRRIRGGA